MKIIQLNEDLNNRMKQDEEIYPFHLVETLTESRYYSKWHALKPPATFEFAYPEDVKDKNEKYCVYLHVFEDLINSPDSYTFLAHNRNDTDPNSWVPCVYMPKHIWEDSEKGNVLWIVDWSSESYVSKDYIDISLLPKALNIQQYEENLIVLTAAELRYKDINLGVQEYCNRVKGKSHVFIYDTLATFLDRIQVNEQLNSTDFVDKKIKSIYEKQDRHYYSVCYNRLPRMHRCYIVSHMKHYGYLDKCNYSLGLQIPYIGQEYGIPKDIRPDLTWYIRDLELDSNVNNTYLQLREASKDNDRVEQQISADYELDIDLHHNQADHLNIKQSMQTYLHVVTETMSNDNLASPLHAPTFITEKSYKPFFMLQPFIAFGSKDNLLSLQRQGFDVFDKWINVSYDGVKDEGDRLKMFLKELDRLHTLSETEWKQMMIEMLPSIIHNFYNYLNYDPNDILVKISTIAMQFKHKEIK